MPSAAAPVAAPTEEAAEEVRVFPFGRLFACSEQCNVLLGEA